jgi:hypothetical protein
VVRLGNAEGTRGCYQLASESHFSISPALLYANNLLDKEIEAHRTRRLIEVNILAVRLIALHEQLVS